MDFTLENVSKRYASRWLFRNINHSFYQGKIYGVSGPNGSGKSTLLKIISAFVSPTNGSVNYLKDSEIIPKIELHKYVNLCAPYSTPPMEFTIDELLNFHFKFKNIASGGLSDFLKKTELENDRNKALTVLSSGMLQRLKLGLALMTEADTVLLDEPTSNLDSTYKTWFKNLLQENLEDKIIVIASNEKIDLDLTESVVAISDYQ